MPDEASFADISGNEIDALVGDIAALASLREVDDDRYGLWTVTGVGLAGLFYGVAAWLGTLQNPSEILISLGVVCLFRAWLVKRRLSDRSDQYSRLRHRIEQRFGHRLLWNVGQL
jgi:hypothetical protein